MAARTSDSATAATAEPSDPSGTTRSALLASIGWTVAGLAFTLVLLPVSGATDAGHYLSAFVLEKTLSLDNVAMFAAVLGASGLAREAAARVLTGGLIGALVLRVGFIAAGLAVVDAVHSIMLVFAAVLVFSGVKLARPSRPAASPAGDAAVPSPQSSRWIPAGLRARPFAATMIAIMVVDVAFAADSILAAFAITTSAVPIIAANVFAVLGLRPLYVVLSDAIERFRYLRAGIGLLLVGIGAELVVEHFVTVPSWVTLAAVGTCLIGSISSSVIVDRRSSCVR